MEGKRRNLLFYYYGVVVQVPVRNAVVKGAGSASGIFPSTGYRLSIVNSPTVLQDTMTSFCDETTR